MYRIQTIGDVASDPTVTPVSAPQGASIVPSALASVARDVIAQRTGLLVGLAIGAAGLYLYQRLAR